MKMKELTNRMDRKATYFWVKELPTGYRLVNAFTLKTATGVETRLDALHVTRELNSAGFSVAKLEKQY